MRAVLASRRLRQLLGKHARTYSLEEPDEGDEEPRYYYYDHEEGDFVFEDDSSDAAGKLSIVHIKDCVAVMLCCSRWNNALGCPSHYHAEPRAIDCPWLPVQVAAVSADISEDQEHLMPTGNTQLLGCAFKLCMARLRWLAELQATAPVQGACWREH